jgi:hypothetical protein
MVEFVFAGPPVDEDEMGGFALMDADEADAVVIGGGAQGADGEFLGALDEGGVGAVAAVAIP